MLFRRLAKNLEDSSEVNSLKREVRLLKRQLKNQQLNNTGSSNENINQDDSFSDSYSVVIFQADSLHGNNAVVKITLAAEVPGGQEFLADENYNQENDLGEDNEYRWLEANVDPNVLNEKALRCLKDYLKEQYSVRIFPTMENLKPWSYNGYDTEYPLKMNLTIELPERPESGPIKQPEANTKKRRLYGYNKDI